MFNEGEECHMDMNSHTSSKLSLNEKKKAHHRYTQLTLLDMQSHRCDESWRHDSRDSSVIVDTTFPAQ